MRLAIASFLILCALPGIYGAPPTGSFSLSQLAADHSTGLVTVRVEDPVYLKQKRYEGYPLKAVVEKYFDKTARQEPGAELIFHTQDGYDPSLLVSDAWSGRAVIATRDLDAQGSQKWVPFVSNGASALPGAFYLVWTGDKASAQSFPWPYQIESIEIVPASRFRSAEPVSASAVEKKRYEFFKHTCMKCHSINFIGGTMGGELNVPLNVTEYWKPKELAAFIVNPKSVRATSKMPKLGVSPEDALEVNKYLETISRQKVCLTETDCAAHRPTP